METVKETLKEVSDTVQGAGKKAEAEKDKGELAIDPTYRVRY